MNLPLSLTVNEQPHALNVDTRVTLVSLLREHLGLTGTHIGCRTGNCGACTVALDGKIVKSCCILAVEADGGVVTTIEGIRSGGDAPHPLQQAFDEHQALQCGFCTPGMIVAAAALLEEVEDPNEEQIRRALAGNLCRCTGYANIFKAVAAAAKTRSQQAAVA